MAYDIILRLVAGVILMAANGFFVTTEFALTRVRQFPETEFTGHPGLQRAWEMTEELEIYLSACQLGITVTSIVLGIVTEPAMTAIIESLLAQFGITTGPSELVSITLGIIVINLAHVTFAEQVPTYLGVERAKTVAKYCSLPLYIWTRIFSPVVRGADRISKTLLNACGVPITRSWTHDGKETESSPKSFPAIRREMGSLLSGTALSRERQQEVLNALDIGRLPVKDIMIPPEDIAALSTEQSPDEALETMRDAPHTRYPLQNEDTYVGLVYSSSVIQELDAIQQGTSTIEDVSVSLPTVAPNTPVSAVIDRFQADSQELALVTTAAEPPVHQSEVLGLVTATDAFEAITGDIDDPLDEDREE